MVRVIKSLTARGIFRRVPAVKRYLRGGEFWSNGYYISTVGRHGSEGEIRRYIESEGRQKEYTKLHGQQLRPTVFPGEVPKPGEIHGGQLEQVGQIVGQVQDGQIPVGEARAQVGCLTRARAAAPTPDPLGRRRAAQRAFPPSRRRAR